jgi:nucleoside-diphosphate-sugar epimerase
MRLLNQASIEFCTRIWRRENKRMLYFVTGATGFIGGRIVHQLVEQGHRVHALVRDPEKAAPLKQMGVVLFRGDITDRESVRKPMEGVEGVFHLAALYQLGIRNVKRAECVNVDGTRNVLEVMRDLGIRKGVYTSSLAVFSDTGGKIVDETYRFTGRHLSVYDRTKWEAHYRVAHPMMEEELPLVIVLPGVVYGPEDPSLIGGLMRAYIRKKLTMLPEKTAFCWAHVDDVASGHILAMEKGAAGETYIIAGPPHTLVEAFRIAEEVTGIKAPQKHTSPSMLRALSGVMRVVELFTKPPPQYSSEGLRVSAGATYLASNHKAKKELGYRVRPLREGLEQTLQAMREEVGGA